MVELYCLHMSVHIIVYSCRTQQHNTVLIIFPLIFQIIIMSDISWRAMFRKPQNFIWNFDAIDHSSRGKSVSGFGSHIAISGYRNVW